MQNQIFEKINKAVIEGLKAKGLSWFKPWKAGQANAPFNLATDRFYNGFNIFILNYEMVDKGYKYNQWLTFKQVIAKGGRVIKSESKKYTVVYLWKIGYLDNSTGKFVSPKLVKSINPNEKMADGKDRYKKTFTISYFRVYNIAQCEGVAPKVTDSDTLDATNEPNVVAETLSNSYIDKQGSLKLVHLEDSAYYSPSRDVVNMPKLDTFVDADSYYKVLFHELAHSTGHKDRLNRKTLLEVNKWGDTTYAKEELVAEISAMYIVGMLGLEPKDNESNSQAYIKGWCKYLEDKPKECVYAMQQATKVVDYINQ